MSLEHEGTQSPRALITLRHEGVSHTARGSAWFNYFVAPHRFLVGKIIALDSAMIVLPSFEVRMIIILQRDKKGSRVVYVDHRWEDSLVFYAR